MRLRVLLSSPRPRRFNGAALRRARRYRRHRTGSHRQGNASTGPRSGERGDPLAMPGNVDSSTGFNGAALRRARRCLNATGALTATILLQRGRAPESAEMCARGCCASSRGTASTGPRSGERGDDSFGVSRRPDHAASTGPRSGERGDSKSKSWRGSDASLQRGRAPESAEM